MTVVNLADWAHVRNLRASTKVGVPAGRLRALLAAAGQGPTADEVDQATRIWECGCATTDDVTGLPPSCPDHPAAAIITTVLPRKDPT
jgi:hypothetical protein